MGKLGKHAACEICKRVTGEEKPCCRAVYSNYCLTKDRALIILLACKCKHDCLRDASCVLKEKTEE